MAEGGTIYNATNNHAVAWYRRPWPWTSSTLPAGTYEPAIMCWTAERVAAHLQPAGQSFTALGKPHHSRMQNAGEKLPYGIRIVVGTGLHDCRRKTPQGLTAEGPS